MKGFESGLLNSDLLIMPNSPVNEDSSIYNSEDSMSIQSAGIWSPQKNRTMSPTTTSETCISIIFPSLLT